METIMTTILVLLQEAVQTQWNQQNVLLLWVYFVKIQVFLYYRESTQTLI